MVTITQQVQEWYIQHKKEMESKLHMCHKCKKQPVTLQKCAYCQKSFCEYCAHPERHDCYMV